MSTENSPSNDNRALHIDFELYTDGDPAFKIDFVNLLIDNLKELQKTLHVALEQNDVEMFRYTSHKIKPTLSIINDHELITLVEDLSVQELSPNQHILFHTVCDSIIKSLEKEILQ